MKVPKQGDKVPWKTSKKPVSEKVPWYGAKKTIKEETDLWKRFVDDEAEDDFGGDDPDESFDEGDAELSEGE